MKMHQKKRSVSLLIILFPLIVSGQNAQQLPLPGINDSLSLQQIVKQVAILIPYCSEGSGGYHFCGCGDRPCPFRILSQYFRAGRLYHGWDRVPNYQSPCWEAFELYPQNNYNAEVDVNEVIYDFSKTSRNVKMEESGKTISEKSVELVKQRLNLVTVISYYTLVYLQEALKINNVQLGKPERSSCIYYKKKETGSATQYEILPHR